MPLKSLRFVLASLAGAVALAGGPLRADLLVSGGNVGVGYLSGAKRYSDSGVFLGVAAKTGDESTDAISIGPDGHIYLLGNTLGSGILNQFGPSGNLINRNAAVTIGSPQGIAVGWEGNLFVGSTTNSSGQLTGVLQFNASSLQFVQNAIPYVTPPTGSAILDVRFGPDDKLYVAGPQSVLRYSRSAGGAITQDAGYNIPITIPIGTSPTVEIGFRPGSPDLFISTVGANSRIDEYDMNGVFVTTLVPAGSGGLGSINALAFDDNYLYVGQASPNVVKRFDADSGAFIDTLAIPHYLYGGITVLVPEPASLGILGFGATILGVRRRR